MVSEQQIITILYNLFFVSLFVFWIYQERISFKKIVNDGNITYWWIITGLFLITTVILNLFVLKSDVDDAIISGTKSFVLEGANPYIDNVVVHFLDGEEVLGLYHYFPSDLIVYSLFFIIFSPLDSISPLIFDSWFLIANALFLILSYVFVRKIIEKPDSRIAPLYIIFVSPFLFTNSSLMVLYFVIGFYCFKNLKNNTGGIISYIFAAGVKYMTGLFLIIHALEELMYNYKSKGNLLFLRPYIIGTAVFFVTIIPFGIIEVLKATFLYQGDISARSEVAIITGPILVEIALLLNLLDFYNIIFIISAFFSLILAFKFGRDTYEKQMIISFLFMFILPFYGTELFVVSLLLWYFNLFDKNLSFNTSR